MRSNSQLHEANHCQLEQYNDPARYEVARESALVAELSSVQEHAGARKKDKAGAQKWVTQRVKNMAGVGPPAGSPEYTRT